MVSYMISVIVLVVHGTDGSEFGAEVIVVGRLELGLEP